MLQLGAQSIEHQGTNIFLPFARVQKEQTLLAAVEKQASPAGPLVCQLSRIQSMEAHEESQRTSLEETERQRSLRVMDWMKGGDDAPTAAPNTAAPDSPDFPLSSETSRIQIGTLRFGCCLPCLFAIKPSLLGMRHMGARAM